MGYSTLESYFIEDYTNLKDRCKWLEEQMRKHEYGITDLHQRFLAVKGSTCSKWIIRDYLLKNGKMTPDSLREAMALGDEELFDKFHGINLNYYTAIEYTEHEFQYTLHIMESRDEWTAVTDGGENSCLLRIPSQKLDIGDLNEGEWYRIEEAETLRIFLARNLRETMGKALEDYEREQAEKEDSDGSAS